ncbi:peptidase inhibitor family I36 protein [Paraoerskovia marina]|uniref:peptidase inhibitor family I36 protein n=1 Tax=Paraoerskovia marina TaxID=545619 RepID=UPI003D1581F9
MKILLRSVLTLSLALSGLTVGVVGAQAYWSPCPSGYACLWTGTSYNGSRDVGYANYGYFSGMSNRADSAAANGGSCEYTRFYDQTDSFGSYFVLKSANFHNDMNRDANLANGAGDRPGEPWRDRVSSWRFTACSR